MAKLYKHKNFYLQITTLTITAMFFIIIHVSKNYPDKVIENQFTALFVSLLLSSGLFTTISNLLSYLFKASKRIKSIMLKGQYLEGFWIGFIDEGNNGKVSFIVEKIEQSFDEISISGISYMLTENKELLQNSIWNSTVAKIMTKGNELQYTYINSNFDKSDKIKQFTGFAKFYFETFSNDNNEFLKVTESKFPLLKSCSMYGQLNDFKPEGEISLSIEIKISDSLAYDLDYFKKYAFMFWEYRRNMSRIE